MKRGRFSEEQIIGSLKEHQAGLSAAELRRRHRVSEQTFCIYGRHSVGKGFEAVYDHDRCRHLSGVAG
jgi:hypothetical protein